MHSRKEQEKGLRVLIFCKDYLALTETFIYDAVCQLNEYHQVTVLCTQRYHEGLYPFEGVIQESYRPPLWLQKIRGLLRRLGFPVSYRLTTFAQSVKTVLDQHGTEVIHCHFGHKSLLLIDNLPLPSSGTLPVFITFHGYDATRKLRSSASYRRRLRAIFKREDIYPIFVSQALRQRVADYGIESPRSSVRYLGVDTERFQRLARAPLPPAGTFIQVASFREKKGQLLTIEAFHQCCQLCPDRDFRLIFIGDGPNLKPARELTERLKLNERVKFVGPLPHPRIPEWLAQARVYVQHSITDRTGDTEGLPIAILEAMAMEMPILSTRHSGIPEAVEEGVNGLLVDEKDIAAFARQMLRIADWELLPQNRQKVLAQFDQSRQVHRLGEAYRSAIAALKTRS
jgi:glycosyltransferase involved in cell wall biosynthesis